MFLAELLRPWLTLRLGAQTSIECSMSIRASRGRRKQRAETSGGVGWLAGSFGEGHERVTDERERFLATTARNRISASHSAREMNR
jgi:hypothetical protein